MFGSKIYIGGGSMPKPTLDRPKILLLLLLFNPSPLTSPPVMMPLHFTLLNNSSFLSPHGFAISFWCPLSRNAIQPHQQPCLGTSSCQKRRAAFKALETCPDETAGRCQHASSLPLPYPMHHPAWGGHQTQRPAPGLHHASSKLLRQVVI